MNEGSANPDANEDDGIRSRWGLAGSASLSRLSAGFIEEMEVREETVIELSGGVRTQADAHNVDTVTPSTASVQTSSEPVASSSATQPEIESEVPADQALPDAATNPGAHISAKPAADSAKPSIPTPNSDADSVQVNDRSSAEQRPTGQTEHAENPAATVRNSKGSLQSLSKPNEVAPKTPSSKLPSSEPPPPKSRSQKPSEQPLSPKATGWYNQIFDETWIKLEPKSANARARADVRFLVKHCGVPRGGSVLDVGCGTGRHVMELASAGFKPVGLDTSAPFLERAVQDANDKNLEIQFVKGDMRSISFPPTFSAVTFFRTTFGYFDDATNRDVLRRVAASLVRGGQLIIDSVNRDWVVATGASRLWWEQRDLIIMEDVDFGHRESRLTVERTIVGENLPKTKQSISIRLYTLSELEDMFDEVGLQLVDITGSPAHPGIYLGASNPRVIIRARKPTN